AQRAQYHRKRGATPRRRISERRDPHLPYYRTATVLPHRHFRILATNSSLDSPGRRAKRGGLFVATGTPLSQSSRTLFVFLRISSWSYVHLHRDAPPRRSTTPLALPAPFRRHAHRLLARPFRRVHLGRRRPCHTPRSSI